MASAAAHAYERAAVPAGRSISVGHLRPCAQVRCLLSRAQLTVCMSLVTQQRTYAAFLRSLFSACWACLLCMHACAHTRAPRPGGMRRGGSWCGCIHGVCLG